MIHETQGNLLADDAEALVNTVNTVGVMGKGIALHFKRAYPGMFADYAAEAQAGRIQIGRMHVWETGSLTGPRYIINFPTKRHWRAGSRVQDIEAGLQDLVRVLRERGIRSLALPPLGCGNGGLDWADVGPRIHLALDTAAPDVQVRLYLPSGAPPARAMTNRAPAPRLTPMRAALLALMGAYHAVTWEWPGVIETQKLAYLLQESGEPLRLDFVKGPYGPYADALRRTLCDMEGHCIIGFGDGSARPLAAEPLEVRDDVRETAQAAVGASPDTAERVQRVLDLVTGFEGRYDLELLASVHWAACKEDADSPEAAGKVIHSWTARKADLFSPRDVRVAWEALESHGWVRELIPG